MIETIPDENWFEFHANFLAFPTVPVEVTLLKKRQKASKSVFDWYSNKMDVLERQFRINVFVSIKTYVRWRRLRHEAMKKVFVWWNSIERFAEKSFFWKINEKGEKRKDDLTECGNCCTLRVGAGGGDYSSFPVNGDICESMINTLYAISVATISVEKKPSCCLHNHHLQHDSTQRAI